MGSQCDIDKKNVIMVNIKELNEEDKRKYTELQEYIVGVLDWQSTKGSTRGR
jgi:hypothetical protein